MTRIVPADAAAGCARVWFEIVRAAAAHGAESARGAALRASPSPPSPSLPRAPRATLPAADQLPAVPDLPEEQRAVQVVGGSERTVAVGAAHARGLTVVDLSDAWVPSVIDDHAGPKGATLVNPYHAIYVGLAADRTDGDGQPLAASERNYLELYGVPPSLTVSAPAFSRGRAARLCGVVRSREAAGGRRGADLGGEHRGEGARQAGGARHPAGGGARGGRRRHAGGAGGR